MQIDTTRSPVTTTLRSVSNHSSRRTSLYLEPTPISPPSTSLFLAPLTTSSSASSYAQVAESDWSRGGVGAGQEQSVEGVEDESCRKGKGKGKGKGKLGVVEIQSGEERCDEADLLAKRKQQRQHLTQGHHLNAGKQPSGLSSETNSLADVQEVIKWQMQQPIRAVDPLNFDFLLPYGIGDYSFISDSRSEEEEKKFPLIGVLLGKGKFSEVWKVRKGNVDFALKHTPLHPHHPLIATRLLREPTILADLLPHPNLVRVFESIRTPGNVYLVEENLGSSITLERLVMESKDFILDFDLAWDILRQLVSCVRALHSPLRVCHRDIKPDNILIEIKHPRTPDGKPSIVVKLLDFGLATHFSASEAKLSTCCGSPAYHSPELWKGARAPPGSVRYWGPEVDIWCVGLSLLRVVSGTKYPIGISHESLASMSDRVVDALLVLKNEKLRRVLAGFLTMDGGKRLTYWEWFNKELEKEKDTEKATSGKDDGTLEQEKKVFKMTSFLLTEPKHSLDLRLFNRPLPQLTPVLPVVEPVLSSSSSTIPRTTSLFSVSDNDSTAHSRRPSLALSLATTTSTGFDSPILSPTMSSYLPLALAEPPPSSTTPTATPSSSAPPPPPIEIVLTNERDEPILRAVCPSLPTGFYRQLFHSHPSQIYQTSYIKYALRCSGIVYHVRTDPPSPPSSPPSCPPAAEPDSSYRCYLQCVALLPATPPPLSTSGMAVRALRAVLGSLSFGGAKNLELGNVKATPKRKKKSGESKEKERDTVDALVFFVEIRKVDKTRSTKSMRGRKAKVSLPPPLGDASYPPCAVVLKLSDRRAKSVVEEALRLAGPQGTSLSGGVVGEEDQMGAELKGGVRNGLQGGVGGVGPEVEVEGLAMDMGSKCTTGREGNGTAVGAGWWAKGWGFTTTTTVVVEGQSGSSVESAV